MHLTLDLIEDYDLVQQLLQNGHRTQSITLLRTITNINASYNKNEEINNKRNNFILVERAYKQYFYLILICISLSS